MHIPKLVAIEVRRVVEKVKTNPQVLWTCGTVR